ncbi:MAG TPA: DUF4282 domain-containing protein [Candidatus Barnesiella merdipullorum]|nr:DUF4282 domain-containing protein [Candidatus Barnesiella merdipullorum]
MDDKLLSFLDPVWRYIDNGSFFREPFRWLYIAIAALNLLFPFVVIFLSVESGIFKYMPGGAIFAFVLVFILLLALGAMSFLLWMNRQKKLKEMSHETNEFVAIPMVSHFIQTLGEWMGFYIGIFGCVASLLFMLFGGGDMMGRVIGDSLLPLGTGIVMVIVYPIMGFLIVVSARLLAELYRALASIANNTKRISSHIDGDK